MLRARLSVLLALVALTLSACSSTSPQGSKSPAPSPGSSTIAPTPSDGASPRARPADRRPTGRPAPAPPAPGKAPQHLPPAAGTYTYTQSGSFEMGAIRGEPDPTGTLTAEVPRIEGKGQAQRQIRKISSSNEIESVYLFTPEAVLLTYVSQQGVECAPEPPLVAIELPLKVNAHWKSHGECGDVQMDLQGQVMAEEERTIGGKQIDTFRVHLAIEIRADQVTQTTGIKAWLSPAYRMVVRSEESSVGSLATARFTSSLTAELRSLDPA